MPDARLYPVTDSGSEKEVKSVLLFITSGNTDFMVEIIYYTLASVNL